MSYAYAIVIEMIRGKRQYAVATLTEGGCYRVRSAYTGAAEAHDVIS